MAVATRQRTGQQKQQKLPNLLTKGSWNKIFPVNLNTRTESLAFVKKLTAVGISNILYLRSSLPEDAFTDHMLDGLRLKILQREGGDEAAQNICGLVDASFDAVEKGYLKHLVLVVMADPENKESVIETYAFHFQYSDDGGVAFSFGHQDQKGQSIQKEIKEDQWANDLYRRTRTLLHKINVATNSLEMLPEKAFLHVKLEYYEDKTPGDYEPPGFVSSDWQVQVGHDGDEQTVVTPCVATKHHALTVKIRANGRAPSLSTQQQMASQSQPSQEPKSQNKSGSPHPCGIQVGQDQREVLDCACKSVAKTEMSAGGDAPVKEIMLTCANCNTLQHGECFLIFAEDQIPQRHLCHKCAVQREEDDMCTDPKLSRKQRRGKEIEIKHTAMYRRILAFCFSRGQGSAISANDLANFLPCSELMGKQIMAKLITDDVVKEDNGSNSSLIGSSQPNTSGKIRLDTLKTSLGPKFLGSNFEALLATESPVNSLAQDVQNDLTMEDRDKSRQPNKRPLQNTPESEKAEPKPKRLAGQWSDAKKIHLI